MDNDLFADESNQKLMELEKHDCENVNLVAAQRVGDEHQQGDEGDRESEGQVVQMQVRLESASEGREKQAKNSRRLSLSIWRRRNSCS